MNRKAIVVTMIAALALTACMPITREAAMSPAHTADAEAILQRIVELDPQAPDYAELAVALFAPDGDLTLIFGPGSETYLRGKDILRQHYQVMAMQGTRMMPGTVTAEGNIAISRGQTEMGGMPAFPTKLAVEVEDGLIKHATWSLLLPPGAEPVEVALPVAHDRTPRAVVEEYERLSQPLSTKTVDESLALFSRESTITLNMAGGGQQVMRGRQAIRTYRETLAQVGGYTQFEILSEAGETVTAHGAFWAGAGANTPENPPQTAPFSEFTIVFTVRDGLIQAYEQSID